MRRLKDDRALPEAQCRSPRGRRVDVIAEIRAVYPLDLGLRAGPKATRKKQARRRRLLGMQATIKLEHDLIALEGEHDVHAMLELAVPEAPGSDRGRRSPSRS
jgi:hypothetical protein